MAAMPADVTDKDAKASSKNAVREVRLSRRKIS